MNASDHHGAARSVVIDGAGPRLGTLIELWRRTKAAILALDQFGECKRRPIFKVGSDELHSDRQAFVAACQWKNDGWIAR